MLTLSLIVNTMWSLDFFVVLLCCGRGDQMAIAITEHCQTGQIYFISVGKISQPQKEHFLWEIFKCRTGIFQNWIA